MVPTGLASVRGFHLPLHIPPGQRSPASPCTSMGSTFPAFESYTVLIQARLMPSATPSHGLEVGEVGAEGSAGYFYHWAMFVRWSAHVVLASPSKPSSSSNSFPSNSLKVSFGLLPKILLRTACRGAPCPSPLPERPDRRPRSECQGKDEAFGTFYGKTLLPDEFGIETLRRDRFIKVLLRMRFLFSGEVGMIVVLVDVEMVVRRSRM